MAKTRTVARLVGVRPMIVAPWSAKCSTQDWVLGLYKGTGAVILEVLSPFSELFEFGK